MLGRLWVRDFDVLEWRRLPGTERASNPFWSPDGRHLGFVADNTVKKIDLAGGAASALTEVDVSKGEFYRTWPTFLPDGRRFLYFRSGPPDIEGMYVGSLDVAAANQSRQRVLAGRAPAMYANGYVFFLKDSTLMAQPLPQSTPDGRRLLVEVTPVQRVAPSSMSVVLNWPALFTK